MNEQSRTLKQKELMKLINGEREKSGCIKRIKGYQIRN